MPLRTTSCRNICPLCVKAVFTEGVNSGKIAGSLTVASILWTESHVPTLFAMFALAPGKAISRSTSEDRTWGLVRVPSVALAQRPLSGTESRNKNPSAPASSKGRRGNGAAFVLAGSIPASSVRQRKAGACRTYSMRTLVPTDGPSAAPSWYKASMSSTSASVIGRRKARATFVLMKFWTQVASGVAQDRSEGRFAMALSAVSCSFARPCC